MVIVTVLRAKNCSAGWAAASPAASSAAAMARARPVGSESVKRQTRSAPLPNEPRLAGVWSPSSLPESGKPAAGRGGAGGGGRSKDTMISPQVASRAKRNEARSQRVSRISAVGLRTEQNNDHPHPYHVRFLRSCRRKRGRLD